MSAGDKPFLQIVRGDATAEEIAAVVAVLTARARAAQVAAGAAAESGRPVSRWAERSRMLRGTVSEAARPRGAGAWRASAFPR